MGFYIISLLLTVSTVSVSIHLRVKGPAVSPVKALSDKSKRILILKASLVFLVKLF